MLRLCLSLLALSAIVGCQTPPPDEAFIQKMDNRPEDERPPNWEHVKALMVREPPAIGEITEDFTLPLADGSGSLTRSVYQGDKPIVLIFGSYT